jgi:hypothetical protein
MMRLFQRPAFTVTSDQLSAQLTTSSPPVQTFRSLRLYILSSSPPKLLNFEL